MNLHGTAPDLRAAIYENQIRLASAMATTTSRRIRVSTERQPLPRRNLDLRKSGADR